MIFKAISKKIKNAKAFFIYTSKIYEVHKSTSFIMVVLDSSKLSKSYSKTQIINIIQTNTCFFVENTKTTGK